MKANEVIRLGAKIELARRHLFDYCSLMFPNFYQPKRQYLVEFCNDLEKFINSDDDVLVVNMPPRHGKSLTATLLVEWLLGKDRSLKIMTGSYGDTLSIQFSKNVRNTIQTIKTDHDTVVYSDVFPETKIKYGDSAMNLWSLEGSTTTNYLATSPKGTATGFGADMMIVDDVIKSAEEANNANQLDKLWSWFTDTMMSRMEHGAKCIVIMTRWHSQDLAGRVLKVMPDNGYKVRHVNMKAIQEDGSMLCDAILSKSDYQKKIAVMGEDIASANYQQEPIDLKGVLYQELKTYERLPEFDGIYAYCDTADTGSDYLVSIVYGLFRNEAYVLDVVMTQEPMEVTESLVSNSYYRNQVNKALIESNNGGRGFARQVDSILKTKYQTNQTVIKWFHNSQNKDSRILSNSSWIKEHVYFPNDWRQRFPDFFNSITKYQRTGKNLHDDAPDALTGVAEFTLHMTNEQTQKPDREKQIQRLRYSGLI